MRSSRYIHRVDFIKEMHITEDIFRKWLSEMEQGKHFIRKGKQTFVDIEETDKWLAEQNGKTRKNSHTTCL